ncbi:MAG TPA: dihydrofolate reductase family protein [Verrucomicrobiae bacterium]|nr:dihydrofolate reductase family protein [Verrucomicrobiae bacterium]
MKLPFVFLDLAMTADGKIASANRRVPSPGSPRDIAHMMELRTHADAVISGARTVDVNDATLGTGGAKYRRMRLRRGLAEYNIRVIASGSGSIDPKSGIFKKRTAPLIVLTSKRVSKRRLQTLQRLATDVKAFGKNEIDFRAAFAWLREKWKVKRLLCEGGGELNGALFRAGLVDELHLTICPYIFGGQHAPTICDGEGIAHLKDAFQMRLRSMKRVDNELFLVFRRLAVRGGTR